MQEKGDDNKRTPFSVNRERGSAGNETVGSRHPEVTYSVDKIVFVPQVIKSINSIAIQNSFVSRNTRKPAIGERTSYTELIELSSLFQFKSSKC